MIAKILVSLLVIILSVLGVATTFYALMWQMLDSEIAKATGWVQILCWIVAAGLLVFALILVWRGKWGWGIGVALLTFPATMIGSQILIAIVRNFPSLS